VLRVEGARGRTKALGMETKRPPLASFSGARFSARLFQISALTVLVWGQQLFEGGTTS